MRGMRFWLSVVAFLAHGIACALPEFIGSQSLSQGQSLTGSSQLNGSLFNNPAASAFTQVYTLDGAFSFPRNFAISILDTRTSQMGGSLGYFRSDYLGTDEPLQGVKLGFASRGSTNFAIGAAGKMMWAPPRQGTTTRLADADVGALYSLEAMEFGLTFRNLFGGNAVLQQLREWAFGLRFKWQDVIFLSASSYSNWDRLQPYQYGFGFEYVSPFFFSLKAGYRIQPDASLSYWSTGASLVTDKISIHYAVEFPNQTDTSINHQLGTTVMF